MTCRYCGKTIPDDAVFCPSCGKRIEAHLRPEDREAEKKDRKKDKYVYEEPKGKRRVKALISVIAAIVFVVAALAIVMTVITKFTGEAPWHRTEEQAAEPEENIGFPKTMYVSAEEGLLLRKDPMQEGKAVHLLNYGREIQVEKIMDGWAYTTADGLSGWCSAEYLTENRDEIKLKETRPASDDEKGKLVEPSIRIGNGYHGTVNSDGGLNLRCGPGADYDIILVVPDKTEIIEEGWDNGWLYICHNGQYGWINAEYVTPTGEVEN